MISVRQVSVGEYEVAVASAATTTHRVSLSEDQRTHLAGGDIPAERLIEESFRFLLEREPNTSILSAFELPVIGRYFPEYEREIRLRLRAN